MLDAEPKVGLLVERALLGGVDVGGLLANRFVAVSLRQLDAAVSLAVLDVGTTEDDQSNLQLLGSMRKVMAALFCAGSVSDARLSL